MSTIGSYLSFREMQVLIKEPGRRFMREDWERQTFIYSVSKKVISAKEQITEPAIKNYPTPITILARIDKIDNGVLSMDICFSPSDKQRMWREV